MTSGTLFRCETAFPGDTALHSEGTSHVHFTGDCPSPSRRVTARYGGQRAMEYVSLVHHLDAELRHILAGGTHVPFRYLEVLTADDTKATACWQVCDVV
jgi:hypothetical protein